MLTTEAACFYVMEGGNTIELLTKGMFACEHLTTGKNPRQEGVVNDEIIRDFLLSCVVCSSETEAKKLGSNRRRSYEMRHACNRTVN